jgi:hypothetical protein
MPKAVTKLLRSRIVPTTDLPKSTTWIRRSLLETKKTSGRKDPHKKRHQKGNSLNQIKVQNFQIHFPIYVNQFGY